MNKIEQDGLFPGEYTLASMEEGKALGLIIRDRQENKSGGFGRDVQKMKYLIRGIEIVLALVFLLGALFAGCELRRKATPTSTQSAEQKITIAPLPVHNQIITATSPTPQEMK